MPANVRPATEDDLPAVKAIYDEQVRRGIATFDLEEPPLSAWQAKLDSAAVGDHLLVATDEHRLLGFASSSAYRPRPAYGRTRETSVYLDADARGSGVGRLLYDELLDRLRTDEVHTAIAVVALPNPASEALHRACGFEAAGVLPQVGFKFERWIDTALYARRLRRRLLQAGRAIR